MVRTRPLSVVPRLFSTSLVVVLVTALHAQIASIDDTTSAPIQGAGHDYIHLLSETVNPANGSVSLRIQLPVPKGRGITLPLSINYDSNGIFSVIAGPYGPGTCCNYPWAEIASWKTFLSQGGWSYGVPLAGNSFFGVKCADGNTPSVTSGYVFQDTSGGRHSLLLGSNDMQDCAGPTYGIGGDSQYYATLVGECPTCHVYYPPLSISDANGTIFYFSHSAAHFGGGPVANGSSLPDYIEDRNGNKVTFYDNGLHGGTVGAFTVTDTAGRTVMSSNGFGPTGSTNTIQLSQGTYTVSWKSTSPSANTLPSIQVNAQPGITCGGLPASWGTGPQTVIKEISLPNGLKYKFYYGDDNPDTNYRNPYGLLSEIDYPAGASVRYKWKMSDQYSNSLVFDGYQIDNSGQTHFQGQACQYEYSTPVIASRTVSYSGNSPSLTQQFTYGTSWVAGWAPSWTSKTTTVATTDNVRGPTPFQTKYSYVPYVPPHLGPPYEISSGIVQVPLESSVQDYDWNNTASPVRTVNKVWANPYDLTSAQTVVDNAAALVTYTYNHLGGLTQLHEKDEYDYGATSPSRKTITNYHPFYGALGMIADRPCQTIVYDGAGAPLAETDLYYDNSTILCTPVAGGSSLPGTGAYTNHDEVNYGTTSTLPRGNVTTRRLVSSGSTTPTTTYTYDETGQVISSTDPCGNTTCADMPTGLSHTTSYSYSDSYTVLSGGQNVNYTPTANTNANLTNVTDPLGHTSTFKYDFNNGQVTKVVDQNSQTTAYIYNDSFARPTLVTRPDTGQTAYSYIDSAPSPSVTVTDTVDNTVTPNVIKSTKAVMDGLGHLVQTQLTSDPDGVTFVDTTYDGMGLVYTRSNPHRSSSSTTDGITTFLYDGLGRACVVGQPDGPAVSGPPCPTTAPVKNIFTQYTGSCMTVTDETGKSSKSCSDAFGRLTQVFEDPAGLNYETDYQYDPLGNLTSVIQKGSAPTDSTKWRTRTFVYDTLSRLTSATNPESGTISYFYDANGNVTSKESPKPNQSNPTIKGTVNYCYDSANRVTGKAYNSSSCPPTAPQSTYIYDQGANGIGRRTGMVDGPGSSSWTYDVMGRIATESRITSGVTRSTMYDYNQVGLLRNITYPSGRTLSYAYSLAGASISAGRPVSVTDTAGSINYLKSALYAPQGALQMYTNGFVSGGFSGINTANTYNSRLQPVLLSAANPTGTIFSLCYDFHSGTNVNQPPCNFPSYATGNNGNVFQIVNNRDTNRTQVFTYDSLNRIQQAYSNGPMWGETFGSQAAPGAVPSTSGIDAWGNLWQRSPVTGKTNYELLSVSALNNNQLSGYGYDAAGNMTSNSNGSATYQYNQEGQLTKFITTDTDIYIYDGDGRRVKKNAGAVGLYWYDSNGNVLDETAGNGSLTSEYVYFNNKRIARRDANNGSVHYYFSDHLGSESVVTDAVGTMSVCPASNSPMNYTSTPTGEEESDFYPYGGEMQLCTRSPQHYKYSGKERDGESSLDYFGARYFSSALGRWMSPDWAEKVEPVPYVKLDDPKTLNLYSHVQNNPSSRFDNDGHATIEIRYTTLGHVAGISWNHAYLVVTDTNGARTYFRAGPSAGAAGFSRSSGPSQSSGQLSGASGGKSSQSSGSGSSGSDSSNSSSPGSAGGAAGDPFGQLVGMHGSYVPGTIDYETNPAASTTLLSNDVPASGYIKQLTEYEQSVNGSDIPYNPLSTNSNAYAVGAANALGLPVPAPPVNAPGSSTKLPVTPTPPPPPSPPPPPCATQSGGCQK